MWEVTDNIIRVSRGDSGSFDLTIPIAEDENYEFAAGDKIQFRIFKKKDYSDIVFEKEIEVEETIETVIIPLSAEETKIGEEINKPETYWYEIDLNNEQTIIGYNEEGPAQFILYPAKGGE